ncbi:MAG: aminomethyltransferase family protein, partial [Burkholderiales bacterium]
PCGRAVHRERRVPPCAQPMNAVEQHLATRRSAGLFDFSFMGLYEFSGSEALARVQTRRLSDIVPGQIAYALLLNDDGSVFNDATVWNMGADRWWLFTGRRSDFEWISARASARDRSGEHAILALQGPLSGRILAHLVGEEIVRQLRYFRFIENGDLLIGRLGYSGELGYELMMPVVEEPRLRAALLTCGANLELCECSFEAANSLRIESGYVLFGREIDGRANPCELGLQRLVSDKTRKFNAARKLVGLEIEDMPPRADLPVAQATSECRSPSLGRAIALGFADPDVAARSSVALADGRTARLAQLPFYDPARRLPRGAPL